MSQRYPMSQNEEALWDAIRDLQRRLTALQTEFTEYRNQHAAQHMGMANSRLDTY